MIRAVRNLFAVIMMIVAFDAAAQAGLAQMRAFLSDTRTLEAQFDQSVTSAKLKAERRATGRMALSRPGRFNWEYDNPYPQRIVGDGHKVWVYDPELNQVTVKAQSDALAASPAALLTGSGDLEQAFELSEDGVANGLAWVAAKPRGEGSGFTLIRLAFADGELQAMELHDSFGQTTRLRFFELRRNQPVDDGEFRFQPPADADVIGE